MLASVMVVSDQKCSGYCHWESNIPVLKSWASDMSVIVEGDHFLKILRVFVVKWRVKCPYSCQSWWYEYDMDIWGDMKSLINIELAKQKSFYLM